MFNCNLPPASYCVCAVSNGLLVTHRSVVVDRFHIEPVFALGQSHYAFVACDSQFLMRDCHFFPSAF